MENIMRQLARHRASGFFLGAGYAGIKPDLSVDAAGDRDLFKKFFGVDPPAWWKSAPAHEEGA